MPTKRVAWKVIKGCRIGEYVQRVMDCGTGQRTLIKHCNQLHAVISYVCICHFTFHYLLLFSSCTAPFPGQTQPVSE